MTIDATAENKAFVETKAMLKKHLETIGMHMEVVQQSREMLKNHPARRLQTRDDALVEAVWFLLNFVGATVDELESAMKTMSDVDAIITAKKTP
jgi:hypothetical protein